MATLSRRMNEMTCTTCGNEIEPGEFMAVIAKAPTKHHVGRTDAVIKQWIHASDGDVLCENCFNKK